MIGTIRQNRNGSPQDIKQVKLKREGGLEEITTTN